MSGVDSNFSGMSDVNFERRMSVSGCSGVLNVELTIMSVNVGATLILG